MAPPPELNSDAVAEILLHLPPDDPAGLVRASAVCKLWLRTLSDPGFQRDYRALHGTPHVLGFLHNRTKRILASFVPTTAFRPHPAAAAAAHRTCAVLDCRHGRALLHDSDSSELVVWDPVTGREHRIPDKVLPHAYPYRINKHAVLCAATGAGCDHSACSGGPFLLACAGAEDSRHSASERDAYACFYSSETGETSEQTHLRLDYYCSLKDGPASLVGGALYFASYSGELLRYDVLGGHGLSVMELPEARLRGTSTILMAAGNGGLGLATFEDGMLALWSTETGPNPNGGARWVHTMLIDLQKLLPVDIGTSIAWLSGFAEDANVIFLSTDDKGVFTIDLKSLLTAKMSEIGNANHVFPYVSFHSPAGLKLRDNDSSSKEKLQRWKSDDDARSSKDSMLRHPWTMENEQFYGEGKKANNDPPTKRQKVIP